MRGLSVDIPVYWKLKIPGVYKCQLPLCKYRRFSYHAKKKKLIVQLHCFLRQRDCTPEDCQTCKLALPDTGKRQRVENLDGSLADQMTVRITDRIDPQLQGRSHWVRNLVSEPPKPPKLVEVTNPVEVTASWQHVSDNFEAQLPPLTPTDRIVHFNPDGSIEYEDNGDWELPRDLAGYTRDGSNPLKFIPRWLPCALRHQIAWRWPVCGCIGIRLRCSNPVCKKFANVVTPEICSSCEERK